MMWPLSMNSNTIRESSADTVPPAADSVVLMADSATTSPTPKMASAEPGLKPYQPNQRMKTPSIARDALWPGMVTGCTTTCQSHVLKEYTDACAATECCSASSGDGLQALWCMPFVSHHHNRRSSADAPALSIMTCRMVMARCKHALHAQACIVINA
jgi:hypothetical protein